MFTRAQQKLRLAIAATVVLAAFAVVAPGCGGSGSDPTPGVAVGHAQITDFGTYYGVTLDYTGATAREVGADYGRALKAIKPEFEALLDTYLGDMLENDATFAALMHRVNAIKPQLDQQYRDEIEGIASALSGGSTDQLGDNQLSLNELYMVNLATDALRATQCSFASVWGPRSATRRTMAVRVLDWPDGPGFPLAKCQAVIHYVNGAKSICTIGYLGHQGVLTGVNGHGLFAAVMDSASWEPYPDPPTGRHSYTFDLRHALETTATINAAAAVMTVHRYAYCHDIAFADMGGSSVLENDQTEGSVRALRTDTSALRSGVTWGIPHAVAAVNSFVLPGTFDNHSNDPYNTCRWDNIVTQMKSKGLTIDRGELAAVGSYRDRAASGSEEYGDVFNSWSQMLMIFEPCTLRLDVAFHPRNSDWQGGPVFTSVPVSF